MHLFNCSNLCHTLDIGTDNLLIQSLDDHRELLLMSGHVKVTIIMIMTTRIMIMMIYTDEDENNHHHSSGNSDATAAIGVWNDVSVPDHCADHRLSCDGGHDNCADEQDDCDHNRNNVDDVHETR